MPLILSKTTDPLIGSDPVESGPGLSWPLNVLDDNIKEKEAESTTCCGKIKLVYFVIQGFVLVLLLYLGVVHLLKKRPQEDVISGNSHRNNKEFHPKEIGQPIDPYFILTGNFNYSGCIVACLESCSYVAAIHSTQEDDDILDILGAHGHGSAWIGMAQFDRDWLNQDSTPVFHISP